MDNHDIQHLMDKIFSVLENEENKDKKDRSLMVNISYIIPHIDSQYIVEKSVELNRMQDDTIEIQPIKKIIYNNNICVEAAYKLVNNLVENKYGNKYKQKNTTNSYRYTDNENSFSLKDANNDKYHFFHKESKYFFFSAQKKLDGCIFHFEHS